MAKNRLVSLCTSWSLRYPLCLISLITNKLAANSVTIADFIVIPTCFFSRREVEKWSTLRTRFFFFVCWRFKRPFFFCKAHDYWRTWAAGKHGTQNNAISFWNKSTLSSKFGVIFNVDTIFFSRLFDSVNENLLIGDTRMKETIGIRHVWICLWRLYIPRILFANQYRHITRRT